MWRSSELTGGANKEPDTMGISKNSDHPIPPTNITMGDTVWNISNSEKRVEKPGGCLQKRNPVNLEEEGMKDVCLHNILPLTLHNPSWVW